MNANHPTRRKFLANMALVSAGTAFRPLTQLLVAEKSSVNLQEQWTMFCKKNRTVSLSGFTADSQIQRCSGHRHEVGGAVYFENENLLAQPTWIFWKESSRRPDDVVISFFEKGNERKKLFRLNRFELESLNRLQTAEDVANSPILLSKEQHCNTSANKTKKGLRIKTSVAKQACSSTVISSDASNNH